MRYNPSAVKLCLNLTPPRRPGGRGSSLFWLAAMEYFTFETRGLGLPTARFAANPPRRGDVLAEERRRHAQSSSDVVEAVDADVLRQDVGLDVHTHQSLNGCGVLGAVEALDRHMARLRTFGMGIEIVLHPGNERIDIFLRRLRRARRRHQMSAQLAQGLLPDLRVVRRSLEVEGVERDAAGFQARVVAGDAVGVQHRAMLIGTDCGSGLTLGFLQDRGRGQQSQEGTDINEMTHDREPFCFNTKRGHGGRLDGHVPHMFVC